MSNANVARGPSLFNPGQPPLTPEPPKNERIVHPRDHLAHVTDADITAPYDLAELRRLAEIAKNTGDSGALHRTQNAGVSYARHGGAHKNVGKSHASYRTTLGNAVNWVGRLPRDRRFLRFYAIVAAFTLCLLLLAAQEQAHRVIKLESQVRELRAHVAVTAANH